MDPFRFHTKLELTILLGLKARNIRALADGIRTVPASSIYHHTHRFLLQHHYLSPEPPNDFAYWTREVANDAMLGERLASVDVIQFRTIEELRGRLLEVLDEHLAGADRVAEAPRGEEFHFMATRMFVLPTAFAAGTLGEFRDALSRVSIHSIYYHMFDARLRLARGDNDFSRWLTDGGWTPLADEIRRLDPYTVTLEGLRKRLLALVRRHEQH